MVNEIRAVIFDLYGTLIYIADKTYPYHRLFQELNLTPIEIKEAGRIALTEDFSNISELVKRIKPKAGIDVKSYEEDITRELNSVAIYPETSRVFEALQEKDIQMGLISNLSSPYKMPFFKLGLDEYFYKVFFSCEIGLKKPDIRIYQRIMQEMGIDSSKTLMVGDTIHCDFYPPISIGINAVLLDRDNKSDIKPRIKSLEEIFSYW